MMNSRFAFAAPVYAVLIAIGIPWYWPADHTGILFGFPTWVIVAISCSLAASVFTAWLLSTPWAEEQDPDS